VLELFIRCYFGLGSGRIWTFHLNGVILDKLYPWQIGAS
jgi:hypothetical protein